MQKEEDFGSYLEDFESSYLMQYNEKQRMQELIKRLKNHPILKGVARELTFTHTKWDRFKTQVYKASLKDKNEVLKEFKNMEQE